MFNTYEYILYIGLIIILIYLSICIFMITIGNSFYIQQMPMYENDKVYQTYHFIPLFLFTKYFDKKIYIGT